VRASSVATVGCCPIKEVAVSEDSVDPAIEAAFEANGIEVKAANDFNDWNASIVAEFRANGGKVSGPFEGAPMVILHTTGAKSGKERINPLMYLPDGDKVVIFASKAGAPSNPDWYHNIVANPSVTLEVGTETFAGTASVAPKAQRDELYARQAALYPQFAEYEAKTDRVIPVVVIERA
jgi:deazaflavin-dependent oxidoreductase (nitroreductase family)